MIDHQSPLKRIVGPWGRAAILLAACDGRTTVAVPSDADSKSSPECAGALTLSFVPDTAGASETYVCFGFDAGALGDRNISRIAWADSPPPFVLHHAKLYAIPGDYPDGPTPCAGMPAGAVGLHVWARGGGNLILPRDTGLVLPAGTRRFVVEAHVLQVGAGAPAAASVSICPGPSAPTHLAAMMPTFAPVPAIRPQHTETSQASCVVAGPLHLFSVWPHMHLIGTEIDLDLLRGDGSITSLVAVTPWMFHAQNAYPLDVDIQEGDRIRTRCTWRNNSDAYVFPGLLTSDEMCNAGFIVWPAASAICAPVGGQ